MSMEIIVNKMCEVFKVSPNCLQVKSEYNDYEIILNASDYTIYVSLDYVSISATNATLKANPQLMTQVDVIQSFLN